MFAFWGYLAIQIKTLFNLHIDYLMLMVIVSLQVLDLVF